MRATNLCNEFVERGYAADILVTGDMSEKPFFTVNDKVNIISLNEYAKDALRKKMNGTREKKIRRIKRIRYAIKCLPGFAKKLERRISFLRAGEKLRPYFLNTPYSVAIAFGAAYIKSVLSAVEGLDCKVIYAEKNAPELECPKDGNGFENRISLLKNSDAVIVQTQDSKNYYSEFLDNVVVINNPIKTGLPKPYSERRSKRIINFCRISEQKNLDLLLDAFELLHREYPEYVVEIYGNIVYDSEQVYKDRLLRRAGELGLSDSFRILPPAADVHDRVLDAAPSWKATRTASSKRWRSACRVYVQIVSAAEQEKSWWITKTD